MIVAESLQIFDFNYFAPYLGQLSFGALAGIAAGFALKKVSKVIVVILGIFFILVQISAYYGYVQIDWRKIQTAINPALTPEALIKSWRNVLTILTFNIPFAASFIPAFILGLKRG